MNTRLIPYSHKPLIQEPLTQRDYEAIKQHLKSVRDMLLAKLLRNTGLRISEALRITPQYMGQDGPHTYCLVYRGKQGAKAKWDRVYLNPELAVELLDYTRGNKIAVDKPVFPISDRQVRNIFYQAGLKAIGRRVHPHEFRHLYTKTLIDGGLPPVVAAKMLGHADSRTTERWYYELTGEQRAEIQRRIPV